MSSEESELTDDQDNSVDTNEYEYDYTDKAIRFFHKVKIDNFSDYIEDKFWGDALLQGEYCSTKQFCSYLELGVNKIDQFNGNLLLVYVHFWLFEETVSLVRYRLRILDENRKCRFEKAECNFVDKEGKYVWKCELDWKCLRKLRKNGKKRKEKTKIGEVKVCCEMTISPRTYFDKNKEYCLKIDKDDENANMRFTEDNIIVKPRVLDSMTHRWIVDNFRYFYQDEWANDEIKSNKFYSKEKHQQFQLSLNPNEHEYKNKQNLSIYLYLLSPKNDRVNVRWKLSIIDEKGEKFNTKSRWEVFQGIANFSQLGKYISVLQLLDRSNGLLSDGKLTLLCEVQVIAEDGYIEDNEDISTEVSESHCNAQIKVIESLAHMWTVDNFGYFYRNAWIGNIESDQFHSSSNKEHQFYLHLNSVKLNLSGIENEDGNYLSVVLCHSSPDNVDVNVRWKLSIIDENGNKLNIKDLNYSFFEQHKVWKFREYICSSKLPDLSNVLFGDGPLSILCEIQILDNEMSNSMANLDPIKSVHDSILELNQWLGLVNLSKCAHKWTIHNFACALADDESGGDDLVSSRFTSPQKSNEFEFYLSIFPKGCDESCSNYVSIRLYVLLFTRMKLTFKYRIELIDSTGNKLKTIDGDGHQGGEDEYEHIAINKFISHDELRQQLLNNDNNAVRLHCEIDVIRNFNKFELLNTIKDEYLYSLFKLEFDDSEVTETVTNAKAKKVQFEYIWEIENFKETSDTESSSLFTSQPTSSYIESPTFSTSSNHSTTNQHRFYLRMFLNGVNKENKDFVSMHFGVKAFEKRQVTCEFKISLIDYFECKFNTMEKKKHRYHGYDEQGWSQYISHFDLVNALATNNNKLTVNCAVEFVDEESIGDSQIKINDKNDKNENTKEANLSIIKPHSTLPTQSITQVTLHTHHWTIENFGLYFQSIQDESDYFETKFSLENDKQQHQLTVKLIPKYDYNQIEIWSNLICNQEQIISSPQVQISIFDKNNRKCCTKTFKINFCQGYAKLGWTDIGLKPKYLKQLKLSFDYELYSHYSSTTEMFHLDQFSLDHFTSPWQVKRLCHVPTHSRALTSIPVESCHFEWSIQEFSSLQESVQSKNFGFTENDQLQFYLRMNLHSQDKMSIYLYTEKSVEKEMRILVQISILDKDGHKCCIQDGFVKMFEGEHEYECVKFMNGYFRDYALGQDDTLRMSCELKLIGEATCTSQVVESIPKVLSNLNKLLSNRQKSDFVFNFVNGKQLHAHRSILSARSPVFEKMFHHDMMEAQHGQVDITDMDMEVCELMLRYIYMGLDQLDQASTLDLMIAADKYQLSELKEKCSDWLCSNLTIESVTNCLVWSDQVGATKLKTKSIEFFHRNSIAISQTNAIKEIIKNSPDLMQELYLDSTRHLNNKTEKTLIEEVEEEEDSEEDISVL